MKLIYKELGIELTRRCNEMCKHCLRGPAEPVDLSKDVIDALFDNNDIDLIENLLLSGGEPTMNGEALLYLVDKLIEKEVIVGSYRVIVNGTYYDDRFGDAIRKLHRYVDSIGWNREYNVMQSERFGSIGISQDQFHKSYDPKVLEKIQELPSTVSILREEYKPSTILPYGRANDNDLSNREEDYSNLFIKEDSFIILGYGEPGVEFKKQYICANGNVCLDPNYPFKILDTHNVGNVLEKPIYEMYGIEDEVTKSLNPQKR